MYFGPASQHNPSQQISLAKELLPERYLSELKRRWTNATRSEEVIFHRQQLWFVLQLALLCSSVDGDDRSTEKEAQRFGECLLIANDLLGCELNKKHERLENPDDARWFFTNFLPSFELNWHSIGHADLARVHSIWGQVATDESYPDSQRILRNKSIDAEFQTRYGIKLSEFIDFSVAVHFLLQDQIDKQKPLRITKDALLQLLPDAVLEHALSLISRSPDELTAEIIFTPRQSWAVDFAPLRKYPLLRLSDEYIACPDLQLLESFFEESLYWLIANTFPQNQNEFRQLYGELFEQHLNHVLGEFLYSGTGLTKQLFTNPKFVEDNTQVCDALIDWPETFALLEYKASRFTRYQKYSGDSDSLFRAIDDAFAVDGTRARKGVGQLAESIQRIIAGDRIATPTQPQTAPTELAERKILPVLVIAEPALCVEFVRQHLNNKLREFLEQRHVKRDSVLPLIVLSHYQVECLEGYSEKGSTECILRSYAQHIDSKMAGLLDGFSDYVARQYGFTIPSTATYMQRMRRAQLKRTHSRFRDHVAP
jgi:hypothetical protein